MQLGADRISGVPTYATSSRTETMPEQPATLLRELRGVIERLTYQNPDNGYTVARLAPERAADAPTGFW
jgi:hypothetical protein